MADALKGRICVKLNVRSGTDSLDKALLAHIEHTNVKSAAAYLMPNHPAGIKLGDESTVYLPSNELLLLYTVDGLVEASGDSQVFILDRTTMERHRQHAASRRTIHYVALTGKKDLEPIDLSSVSKDLPPAGNHVDVIAGLSWGPSPVNMISFDSNPQIAIVPSSTQATQVITRSSSALVDAIAAADAADRGVANIDYETAMTQCCAWLAETIELVESQFNTAEAAAASTLDIVEAFLQRNSALHKAREFISVEGSVFTRIERALHATSLSRQRWVQKKAALDCLAESTRLCTTWIAMLSSYALSLKIRNPATTQSLDGTNETMMALGGALLVIIASFPGQNVTESDQFVHYVQQRVVPRITTDLVQQIEKLLNLASIFDVGSGSIPSIPICTTEGIQSSFIAASWSLRRWVLSWHQTCATLNNVYPTRLTQTATISSEAARYASERCERLRDMLHKVNRASLGIMSMEVAVLYKTMHRAANAFPLLRSTESENWELFETVFNKTLALKFTAVEAVDYNSPRTDTEEAASPVAPFSPLLSQISVTQSQAQMSLHHHTRSMVNASMASVGNNSVLVEEREVLSSRVTIMSRELAEARQLIASLQEQLQRSNAALASAQELNVYMMAEMRKHRLGEQGDNTSVRNDLVLRLAQEEHSRREQGRQIEDEELDS